MTERPRITDHARRRMAQRGISDAAVIAVLSQYHTSRPAPFRPGARPAIIYIGEYEGRDLKVYVVQESDPPIVTTAVWQAEYDPEADAIYVRLSDAPLVRTIQLGAARNIDVAADGSVVGVEFLGVRGGIDLSDIPERETVERLIGRLGLSMRVIA